MNEKPPFDEHAECRHPAMCMVYMVDLADFAEERLPDTILVHLTSPLAALLVQVDDLCSRKNDTYSGGSKDPWSNYRSAEDLGLSTLDSAMMRFVEKVNRIKAIYSGRSVDRVGEPIRETLLDAAAIALIAVAIMDEARG